MQTPDATPNAAILPINSDIVRPPTISAANILQHASVPTEPNVYVLGSYEGRVTIHSQQTRALNLTFALKSTEKLKIASRVAVVGGGIAGMTAAVAAAKLEANVTIFERHPLFLHNLQGCHTRHLHPNIYDWPSESALREETSLPFMNWKSGSADLVARALLSEWSTHVQKLQIIPRPSANVMLRQPSPDGTRRITVTSGQIEELEFDVVILAVGFGVERTITLQPLRSYWRDDSLHQPEIEVRSAPTKYLVSGNGDGGLIDVLRIRLSNFCHEDLIRNFGDLTRLEKVAKELESIEVTIRNELCTGNDPSKIIYDAYSKLSVPSDFDDYLIKKLRKDTEVIFNYQNWLFSYNSSIFHRFLVSRLIKRDPGFSILPGQLLAVEGHEPNLKGHLKTDSGEITCDFNRLVIRHGPQSALGRDFPHSNQQFESILRARNALDETRAQAWPDDFWGKVAAAQVVNYLNVEEGNSAINIQGELTAHPTVVGLKARMLRDELLSGTVTGLEGKLELLNSDERLFLLESLASIASSEERGLQALSQLLELAEFPSSVLGRYITNLVTDALFRNSILRKTLVLGLGSDVLSTADDVALGAFFADIFEIVDNDQFHEVNRLVPALVDVSEVIPKSLCTRYVGVLLRQFNSNSRQGAPAAKLALRELSSDVWDTFISGVDLNFLSNYLPRSALRWFFSQHHDKFPEDKRDLLNDYVKLKEVDFDERYNV